MRYNHKYFIVFTFLFQLLIISSQEISVETNIDFNLINESSPGMVDIPIQNNSSKDVFIFRLDVDSRFKVRFSSKLISPDSTSFIRLWFFPEKRGAVNEKISLHLSCYEDPLTLNIKGVTSEEPKIVSL